MNKKYMFSALLMFPFLNITAFGQPHDSQYDASDSCVSIAGSNFCDCYRYRTEQGCNALHQSDCSNVNKYLGIAKSTYSNEKAPQAENFCSDTQKYTPSQWQNQPGGKQICTVDTDQAAEDQAWCME